VIEKWVAMAKRVPPKEGLYIAYARSADPKSPLLMTAWWDGNAWGLVPAWSDAVTHWMPLPAPPAARQRARKCFAELLGAAKDAVQTHENGGIPGGPILRLRAAIKSIEELPR
jgi:hypothetical protein